MGNFKDDFPSFEKISINNLEEKYIKEKIQNFCRDVKKIKKAIDKATAGMMYGEKIRADIYKELEL